MNMTNYIDELNDLKSRDAFSRAMMFHMNA